METLNLPQYTTPLVGRKIEIADIGDRLQDPACRLLTLVGPGGIGKTRLAIESASKQASAFQDGIFFVALQPVASADSIVRTIGSAIGFEFSANSEPEQQLHQHIHQKDQLLLLDNVEHLLEGAEIIAGLVAATSRLKLLVTSREPLKLQDEWLYHVKGLPFPVQESPNQIETYDAVQLFAEHAGRVQRDFSLDEEQRPVARICRLVQGIPLGIELAAKWRRLLPSVEIARQLQKSLDILQTDLRDVPDRHRSMRAVFNHSWKLLTDEERLVFMALSIFRGGFRRDAAEKVAGASMSLLMSLVDKSLLRVNRNGRFEIHELQRQYAAERLAESPELESAVRDRHSTYYTAFIDRPVNDFLGARNKETLKAIDADIDNIRAAWNWAIENRILSNLSQALSGLYWYAWMRSWHEEAEMAFHDAVAILRAAEPTRKNQISLSRALILQAAMYIWLGRADQAGEPAREGESIVRPLDDKGQLAEALQIQGWAAMDQQNWQEAKMLLEKAVILYDEVNNSKLNEVKAFAFGQLGALASIEGDQEAAERWHRRALKLGREIKDQRTIAEALHNLGSLAWQRGQYTIARQYYEESLTTAQAAEITPFIGGALRGLGGIAHATGHLKEARDYFEESLSISQEDGKGPPISWSHLLLADVLIAQGDYEAALEHLQKTLEIPPGMTDRSRYAAVLASRGHIALNRGALAEAHQHYQTSLALYREMNDRSGTVNNLLALGRIALARNDIDQATDYLIASLQIAIEESAPPLLLHILSGIAELLMRKGDLEDAFNLASLIAQSPASSAESKIVAETILNTPQASLMAAKLDTVSGRERYGDLNRLSQQLVDQLSSQPAPTLIDRLSERELEVLRLVAAGKSNRQIAQELVLAVGTIKTHLHNIMQKLDSSSRTQAVARARELKLL